MNLKTLLRYRLSTSTIVLVGLAAWLVPLAVWRPSPFTPQWAWLLLLLAPLVLVPMGLERVSVPLSWMRLLVLWQVIRQLTMPAAVLLVGAFLLERGWAAALLAVPWLVVCGVVAWVGLARVRQHLRGPAHELCLDAALVYLVVGAAWLVSDRLGYRPLGFEEVIVLLTAIHFHYAGFALPLITGLVLRESKGKLANVVAAAVIAGVPLVAVGITLSQLKMGTWVESLSAWLLAGATIVVAVLQGRLALRVSTTWQVKALWLVSALSLMASMVLAALYGARFHLSLAERMSDKEQIEWMRALHGSANAIGFALAGLAGWWLRR